LKPDYDEMKSSVRFFLDNLHHTFVPIVLTEMINLPGYELAYGVYWRDNWIKKAKAKCRPQPEPSSEEIMGNWDPRHAGPMILTLGVSLFPFFLFTRLAHSFSSSIA
jgi:hypothetical protein